MLSALVRLYQASLIDGDPSQCRFPENRIFGEDWLLRVVLEQWQAHPCDLPFLPFPPQARVYSEAQLPNPFARRPRCPLRGDGRTNADGIVGDFVFEGGTSTGVKLCPEGRNLVVFEAKVSSRLSPGPKTAPRYDQLARTAACMVHAIQEAGWAECDAHLVVLYPRHNKAIRPERYEDGNLLRRGIAERLDAYRAPGVKDPIPTFRAGWQDVLPCIQIGFAVWEDVLAGFAETGTPASGQLAAFYDQCLKFNRAT